MKKPSDEQVLAPVEGDRLDVRVSNLDCGHDASTLRRAMEGARGVIGLEVRAAAASVTVRFDPRETDVEAIRQQLADAGFPPPVKGSSTRGCRHPGEM